MQKFNEEQLQLFENKTIRTAWDEEHEEWYFSIVDVVGILTESMDGRKYWNKLKQRLRDEGNETVTNCHQLKLIANDGKRRFTDVANTEQLINNFLSDMCPFTFADESSADPVVYEEYCQFMADKEIMLDNSFALAKDYVSQIKDLDLKDAFEDLTEEFWIQGCKEFLSTRK